MSNTNGTGGAGDMGAGLGVGDGEGDDLDLSAIIGNAYDELSEADTGAGAMSDASGSQAAGALADAAPAAAAASAGQAADAAKTSATPEHWSADEQARFDALPADVKALAEKRIASIEADYRTKGAANAELADGIRGVVDKGGFRDVLAASGMNEVQGVEYLANIEKFARTQPAEYLKFVAGHIKERFGLDAAQILGLSVGAQPPAQGEGQPAADPRIADLDKRLGAVTTHIQQDATRRAMDSAGREIAAFRDAKDASGNALRPHFAEVEDDMARLVRADPSITLEKAYETAVWSNPTVRAKLQEADREATLKAQREEANAARRAARGNVRGGGRSMEATPDIKTTDDAVNAAMTSLGL